ncbi:hypothetical protein [Burkholderia gladioli]|uniref:hypothetical protein n=1 Tax=Burkholderia gladioli TaxID=28095 RepID=UPI00163F94EB|nr:hypothetical protein [Burkholderia gladioli]
MSRLSIRGTPLLGTPLLGTALLCATLLLAACGGNDDAPRPASSTGDSASACGTRHCAPAP